MASLRTQFSVGLFVIVGFVVAMVAILWLGVAESVKKGTLYVTYFNESVAGLSKDSSIKYRGVEVGRIEEIRITPDSDFVEVTLRIDEKVKFGHQLYSRIQSTGITGMKFVELDKQDPEQEYPLPDLPFEPPYPVIPSVLSSTEMLLTSVDRVLHQLDEMDIEGIGHRLRQFLDEAPIQATIEQAHASLYAIEILATDLHPTASNLSEALAAATETLRDTQYTLDTLRRNMGAINRRSEMFQQDFQETLQNADLLLDELRNQPSTLIFAKPVPERDRNAKP